MNTGYYPTDFLLTENPLSENGNWIQSGVDWADMKSASGLAIGTQASGTGNFDDSHATLSGVWAPNIRIVGVIHRDAALDTTTAHELWLGVRWVTGGGASHLASGYECNVSAGNAAGGSYAEVVKWEGGYGLWNYVTPQGAAGPGTVATGDVFEVTIVGNTINRFFTPVSTGIRAKLTSGATGGDIDITTPNGAGPGTDLGPWNTGSPAIGVFRNGQAGAFDGDYAWDSVSVYQL